MASLPLYAALLSGSIVAAMERANAPLPTPAPLLKHARDLLFIRQTQDLQTCGFIEAAADNALYCNNGMGCAYFTTDVGAQFFECCGTSAAGGIDFNTATCFPNSYCLPYSSHSFTYSGATSSAGTEFCGSASPYCGITYLEASESLTGTFTHFNCEAYSGATSYAYDAVYATSSSESPTTAPPSTRPSSSSSATSTSSGTPTPTPSPKPEKSNTGAIAGGVVGGIAGLAIIGGIIGWLVWRKRVQRREADVPEVSVMPSK